MCTAIRNQGGDHYECGAPKEHVGYIHAPNLDEVIEAHSADSDDIFDVDGDRVVSIHVSDSDHFSVVYAYGDSSPGNVTRAHPTYILIPDPVSEEDVQAAIASIIND